MAAHFQQQQQQQQHCSYKPVEAMNMTVDPCTGPTHSNSLLSKDGSISDTVSCISSAGDATSCSVKENDTDHESVTAHQSFTYPATAYFGYYYPGPGYDGALGGLDEHGYYIPADGTQLQYNVVQGDSGSFIYLMPGIHQGYYPYGPYLPVTTVGVDGQYVGQTYSLGRMFQTAIATPTYIPTPFPYGEFVPTTCLWDPSVFTVDGTHGNGSSEILEILGGKPNMSSPAHTHAPTSNNSLSSYLSNSLDIKSSLPKLDVSSGHGVHNQLKPVSKHVSAFQSDVLRKGYFPYPKFPSYDQGKGRMLCTNNPVKANAKSSGTKEKPKSSSNINGFSDIGLFNEQNHGPRTINAKGSLTLGGNATGSLATDGNGNSNSVTSVIRKDQYSLLDFPTKYDHAFFFVIKSYSEDDVHKSIKYNVWASTPNGNKRLDGAYQDAQHNGAEKGSKCPVFLFFSVNASGQFCGVAEMIGRVDFNKNMDFWQQDKWSGYFPVKWHIIKDVPNPQLRHVILENNENKPVTNSRDTQEVRFPQGIEMLNIFKNYVSKTSILDDFEFYESRQKVMQEKRLWTINPQFDHSHKQEVDELAIQFQLVDLSSGKNIEETQVEYKAKE